MTIDPDHKRLSTRGQCKLVSISRASFYGQPAGGSPENLALMRDIDETFLTHAFSVWPAQPILDATDMIAAHREGSTCS